MLEVGAARVLSRTARALVRRRRARGAAKENSPGGGGGAAEAAASLASELPCARALADAATALHALLVAEGVAV